MESRPTLQDVAKVAGVGKATVSLALRDHPKISAATRARVRAAAEQLHYRPDPALARIAAHRWRTREHPSDLTVAFVTMNHPWTHGELIKDLRLGATEQGDRLGYRLEHFRLDDFPGPEQLARVLFHRGIRGVIVSPILRPDFVERFPWNDFISVGCSMGYVQPPVDVVMCDFQHAMVRAWREAVQAGYRRIGMAMLKEFEAVDLFDKVSAALFCQTRLNPELPAIPLTHFPLEDRGEFKAWMREHRPDVVIGFNDVVYWWLDEAGFDAPKDVAFVSLDTEIKTEGRDRVLSGMNPDYFFIGKTSVSQLDILLRTNRAGIPPRPVIVHVPSVWIAGETMPVRTATEGEKAKRGARTRSAVKR